MLSLISVWMLPLLQWACQDLWQRNISAYLTFIKSSYAVNWLFYSTQLYLVKVSSIRLGFCVFYLYAPKLSFPHVFSGNLGWTNLWIPDKSVRVWQKSSMQKPNRTLPGKSILKHFSFVLDLNSLQIYY